LNKIIRVLAIGDTADNVFTLKKFTKKAIIHLVNFPRKQNALLTYSEEGVEFFDSLLISKQVKKIKQIRDNYDLCLAMSWAGARVAYLAGLNYIMYFVGGDIATPPFVKNPRDPFVNTIAYNLNFIERVFYKRVFDASIVCVGGQIEFNYLRKYRNDAIRMDKVAVDTTLFNEQIKPANLPKEKFTFLSAQRFGLAKGFDIIWKALKLCKSDFRILQIKWFIENSQEEEEFNKRLLKETPTQIEFISLVKRSELGSYFTYADAIFGQMRVGTQGAIERDAAFCKKPVICYTDPQKPMIIDGKEIIPPFLPKTQEPEDLAQLIDKIVESKEFRNKLVEEQYEYIKKLSEPNQVAREWDNLFEKLLQRYKTIRRKSKFLMFENLIANTLERLIYLRKMRARNIRSWGKEEYEKLTK
jgi:glycosyltransferase involved in cell wall biosynthesis